MSFPVVQTLRERRSPLRPRHAIAPPALGLRAVDLHRPRRGPVWPVAWRAVTSSTHEIAFRAHHLARLTSGDHRVMPPVRKAGGAPSIQHYTFLGFDHFVAKALSGAAVLDGTTSPPALASAGGPGPARPTTPSPRAGRRSAVRS